MKPSDIVVQAIQNAFPKDADEILTSLQFDGIMNCWYFTRWGMFVGVELDGYIHS
jgi:hypothetical protein